MVDFDQVHEKFRPQIHLYLKRLVGDFDAEDLTQEVLTKVDHHLKDFRGDSSLTTWIYRIATNAAIDTFRNRKHKMALATNSLTEACEKRNGPPTDSLFAQIMRKEMNDCIHDYVHQLPLKYRMIVILSDLEGWKNQEIADVLGITLENVKIRLHRGRVKLRKMFEANCHIYKNSRDEFECDFKQLSEKTH